MFSIVSCILDMIAMAIENESKNEDLGQYAQRSRKLVST